MFFDAKFRLDATTFPKASPAVSEMVKSASVIWDKYYLETLRACGGIMLKFF
jgi:hypothetical protein